MASEKPTEELSEKPVAKPEASVDISVASSSAKPAATSGAESPRTRAEPDFDDDPPDTPHLVVPERQPTPQKKRVSFQDDHLEAPAPAPPPKPPRPLSPNAQAEITLIEAFPAIDTKVVKAVLVASGGKVEPAFNALLSMSDPDFQEPVPPRPPRKSSATAVSQLEADAIYARQLAQHYDNQQSTGGYGTRGYGDPPLPRRRETGLKPNELYDDREHSFIDDDLPVIKQNLQKGFEDTKKTINKWISDFTKKLDGDEENDDPVPRPGPSRQPRQDFGKSTHEQLYGIRKTAEIQRRSGDHNRGYDADPQVLSDDFGHRLELRDDEAPPSRPPRPAANPNLFRSDATGGQITGIAPSNTRSNAPNNRQPSPSAPAGAAKSGKWQPLSSIEPKSEIEDRDPFSLGDSDEELDSKKETKPTTEKEASTSKVTTEPAVKAAAEPVVASVKKDDKKEEKPSADTT